MVVISKLYPEVIKICRPLIVEDEVLAMLVKKFVEAISKSLGAQNSPVKYNLTHVNDFPDGTEKGSFIGLEFSGRIFRLVYVGLRGDRSYVNLSRLYEFPYQKCSENLSKIVDYIARCINNFMEVYNVCGMKIILGVASSFPLSQECLQEGKITLSDKEFPSSALEDEDFFGLLRVSLKKYKRTKGIYLISVINSATACLLSGLYKYPGTRIGLFLGEETELTYVEKIDNMKAHTGDGLRTRTAIGVGIKNFGDDESLNFIRTEFDFKIDSASANPGECVFDKMISAAYLGEIARLCLYKLASLNVILNGYLSPGLSTKDKLKTSDLAMMEMDDENTFTRCRAVMNNLGYKTVIAEDCLQIRFVCRCVAKRSSNLMAACLTALIQRLDCRYVHIMAHGYLLKDFPHYEKYLNKKIHQLKKPGFKFALIKGDKEEVAVGAGIAAFIYKDGVIKLEDKYRALPPFNPQKYSLNTVPVACVDCNKDSIKTWKAAPSTTDMQTVSSSDSKRELEIFDLVVCFFGCQTADRALALVEKDFLLQPVQSFTKYFASSDFIKEV